MAGYRIEDELAQFGGYIHGWRMVLGLSAQLVAERASISRDTLRKIEKGDATVSFKSVAQVLRALGILETAVNAIDPLASDIGRLRAGRLQRSRV